MLKKLLPKELWKTKINTEEFRCSYNFEEDIIFFNRNYLLKDNKCFIATKIANPIVKTKKDYLIFSLLHELGHRYFKGLYNYDDYVEQATKIERRYKNNEVLRMIIYWKEIPNEKIAEDFARYFFKLYKEKQAKKDNEIR